MQCSNYDEPYTWGLPPSIYLGALQVVRLTIVRSRLRPAELPTAHLDDEPASAFEMLDRRPPADD